MSKKDQRITIKSGETFYKMLAELLTKNEIARLMYDDNGITRAEGKILSLTNHSLTLENDLKIPMSSIVAVNGVFKDDYSEC